MSECACHTDDGFHPTRHKPSLTKLSTGDGAQTIAMSARSQRHG